MAVPEWTSAILRPLVLGPHNTPVITDAATAAANPLLATLSAITHANDPKINAILDALATALRNVRNDEDRAVFIEMIERGLEDTPAVRTWRSIMAIPLSYFRSEPFQRLRAEGVADSLLLVLAARDIEVTAKARSRIYACTDRPTLDTWLERSATATTIGDVFDDRKSRHTKPRGHRHHRHPRTAPPTTAAV